MVSGGSGIIIHPYNDIDDVCDPLRRLGITYFSYTCIYKNGTRVDYNNNPDMTNNYYLEKAIHENTITEYPEKADEGILLWSSCPDDLAIINAEKYFDVTNGLTISKVNNEYTEFFHFGSTEKGKFVPTFIVNNINAINIFCYYIKDKLIPDTALIDNGKINVLTGTGPTITPVSIEACPNKIEVQKFLDEIKFERYRLGREYDGQYLTNREVECLRWSCIGKSSAEIGIILGISSRTVEQHILKVKEKLGCYKQTMMVKIAYDLGLIF